MAVNDRGEMAEALALWAVRAWAEETARRNYILLRHDPTDPRLRLIVGTGERGTARRQGKTVPYWVRLSTRETACAMERRGAEESRHRRRVA
jgi:hypothetical protein